MTQTRFSSLLEILKYRGFGALTPLVHSLHEADVSPGVCKCLVLELGPAELWRAAARGGLRTWELLPRREVYD